MSKVFLVRHGQDTDNAAGILNGHRDTNLNDLGREQARQVAEKLRDNNVQIIYTSPLKRTYETASIIASILGINEVIKDGRLIERDFGTLTGKPVSDIAKYTDKIIVSDRVNYFLEVEGAESFPILLERGRKILEEIKQRHSNKNVLIVTHGDVGKMIRAAHNNWTWEQGLKTPYFDNTQILELSKTQDTLE
jgi:broad specificity phosphatase PhoE